VKTTITAILIASIEAIRSSRPLRVAAKLKLLFISNSVPRLGHFMLSGLKNLQASTFIQPWIRIVSTASSSAI